MQSGKHSTQPGDRRERERSRTVSGAIPDHIITEQNDTLTPIETMRFPWSSSSTPASPTSPERPRTSPVGASPKGHKRGYSGNLLGRFNFLKSGGGEDGVGRAAAREQKGVVKEKEATSPTKSLFSRKSVEDDVAVTSPTSPSKTSAKEAGALSTALKQSNKTRKRTGSLRKTALLGGKRIVSEGRERKGSFGLLQRSGSVTKQAQDAQQHQKALGERREEHVVANDELAQRDLGGTAFVDTAVSASTTANDEPSLRHQASYETSSVASSDSESWPEQPTAVSATRLALLTEHQKQTQAGHRSTMVDDLGSPVDMKSPTSQTSYTSTTDDDDIILAFDRPSKLSNTNNATPHPTPSLSSSATSQSYFPSRLSSSNSRRSPLSHLPLTSPPAPLPLPQIVPHSSATTEYWGYTLLLFTWLTFTICLGSTLDLWSWAWDVGETPYAPPELEDDPTLPIVGYYPALLVLTGGVVCWVWVGWSWVGMKYFRHARVEV